MDTAQEILTEALRIYKGEVKAYPRHVPHLARYCQEMADRLTPVIAETKDPRLVNVLETIVSQVKMGNMGTVDDFMMTIELMQEG